MLEAFVRLLIDIGLVRRVWTVNEEKYSDEVTRVSNCLAIADRLGLDHGYENGRYDAGCPYWSAVGGEYEGAVARARAGLEAGAPPPPLPAGFAADKFTRLVSGKDTAWVEMAGEMITGSAHRRHAEGLVDWYGRKKGECPEEYCRVILREMTSPEIGITLDYDTETSKEEWDARVAEFGSEIVGAESWTAEELAAKSRSAAKPRGKPE